MRGRVGFVMGLVVAVGGMLAEGLVAKAAAEPGKAAGRPNIILCMADDQGWGDVGYAGHPVLKTPNLDSMAAAGLRFDRFYAAAPVCSPTRGSVMTGRHPNRFGCFQWGNTLRPQEVTIAEALKAAGYVTGHFGKWHLGAVRRGSPVNPGASGFDEWLSAPNFFDNDPILSRDGIAVQFKGESSMVTMDAALEFIRQHAGGSRPFLAVVWFGSPHSPHKAVEQDRALYANEPKKRQNFYGEITGLDRAMGKLRKELRTLGIQENTLVWYCSDNGGLPRVSRTGGRGHKDKIYEGGLRVPAIIEWPARIHTPRVTDLPANTCDIFPTLLEIVGLRPPEGRTLDGVSLVSAIDGTMTARPRPMGFWRYPIKGIRTPSAEWMADLLEAQRQGDTLGKLERLRLESAVIDKRYPDDSFPGHAAWLDWPWKLHRIQRKDGNVTIELYDLARDPMEETNVAEDEGERVATMREELEAWLRSVVASLNGEEYRKAS
jgi:arylsulfatase A-like enzyme